LPEIVLLPSAKVISIPFIFLIWLVHVGQELLFSGWGKFW
jgi:hypothetical protein